MECSRNLFGWGYLTNSRIASFAAFWISTGAFLKSRSNVSFFERAVISTAAKGLFA